MQYTTKWAGHVARIEEGRNAFKILTGKPTGKRPLGRPWRRWEVNIKMYLQGGIDDLQGLLYIFNLSRLNFLEANEMKVLRK